MAVGNFYLVAALPTLGDLGSPPPIAPADLVDHVRAAGARPLVETVFLSDDLLQRDAFLAGEADEPEPAVLSAAQVRDEEPLPAYLAVEAEEAPRREGPATDAVWARYFRHAAAVARRERSPFLEAWVGYEVALRNTLARARAKSLDLDPEPYLVAPDLAGDDVDLSALVSEWTDAENPLEGLRVLDRARWQWLHDHDAHFTFADDELGAYAAKLMLLVRWHRLEQAEGKESE
ncbi:MAG: DUF2764 family protein [Phycisphaerae bacterium]